MDTKDKLIGIAMIIAGIAFIVLGSAFLVRSNKKVNDGGQTPNTPNVYQEQQIQNNIYQEVQ